MTVATSDSKFGCSRWIVSPNISDGATHTTIASALTAASSGDTIFVKPGTYTENLTLKAGVNLFAFAGGGLVPVVTILGKATATFAGSCNISGIRLKTNSDFFLVVSGSAETVVNLSASYLSVNNNTAISFTSSNASAAINIIQCEGDLGTTGITYFVSSSPGTISIQNSVLQNTPIAAVSSSASAGTIKMNNSYVEFSVQTTGTAAIVCTNTTVDNRNNGKTVIDHGGTGANSSLSNCNIIAGSSNLPITIGTGATLGVYSSLLFSTTANIITGAGTLNYSGISTRETTTGDFTTTTQVAGVMRPGISRSTSQPAFLAYASGAQTDVTGDGTTYTVLFATEVFDQASNFASSTFTAPYTGKYFLAANVAVTQVAVGMTSGSMVISTTSQGYTFNSLNAGVCMDAGTNLSFSGSVLASMTAGDTAVVAVTLTGLTKTVDITNTIITNFSGYLAC